MTIYDQDGSISYKTRKKLALRPALIIIQNFSTVLYKVRLFFETLLFDQKTRCNAQEKGRPFTFFDWVPALPSLFDLFENFFLDN